MQLGEKPNVKRDNKRKMRDVTFRMWKRGKVVDVRYKGPATFRRSVTADLLDERRIFGVDTESLTKGGELTTVLTTLRFGTQDESVAIETTDGKGMLQKVFDEVWKQGYWVDEGQPKSKRARLKVKGKRAGRRSKVPLTLSVWFNLPYDFGRLIADNQTRILRTVEAGADTYSFSVGEYTVEVIRMFFGSASAFSWLVRHPPTRTIVNLGGIDLCGYWKVPLAIAAKAVGAQAKIDIESVIEGVYEKPFESFTDEEWRTFVEYGLGDVKTHLELYHATAKLLVKLDARVLRQTGVIPPSAPGASARIMFAKAFDSHPYLNEWERYPAWADQLGATSYFGGRVFRRCKGVFRRMVTFDLKSAYPQLMSLLPDPVTVQIRQVQPVTEPSGLTSLLERLKGLYGVLVISGEGLDDIYPAFRIHDELRHGRLKYVYGKFDKVAVTIPEVLIGLARGALRIDAIHDGCVMIGECQASFLRLGVLDFFEIKEANRTIDKALSDMAKLLANSGYGKLIEVQESEYLIIDQIVMSRYVAKAKIAETLVWIYANGALDDGKGEESPLYFGEVETIKRWKGDSLVDQLGLKANVRGRVFAVDMFEKRRKALKKDEELGALAVVSYLYGLEMANEPSSGESCNVGEYLSEIKGYKAGAYFMPLYAAQITGCTSAKVGAMASAFGALLGDTDSVHVMADEFANMTMQESPQFQRYLEVMAIAGYPQPLGKGELGSWEEECKVSSDESVLARTKLYSHRFIEEDGKVTYKQAHHGLPKFFTREIAAANAGRAFSLVVNRTTFEETKEKETKTKRGKIVRQTLLHEAIKELCLVGEYEYVTRPSPRKLVEAARSGMVAGEFVSRDTHASLNEDPNTWVDKEGTTRWIAMVDESSATVAAE
jgi:DNA polymerase type B, organellar and viral